MPDYKIAPSILSADFARLGEEVTTVLESGADIVHFDVMDNHYVPNLTIGPLICEALRKHGVTADIDVHLMVKPVDRIIPDFAAAGATYITFHPEASEHVDRSLQLVRSSGCKSGLVFNPATPLDYLKYVLDKIDIDRKHELDLLFSLAYEKLKDALQNARDEYERELAEMETEPDQEQ